MQLREPELIVVLGAQHLRLTVIGERAVEVAGLHLCAGERHQRIDQRPRLVELLEDALGVGEFVDRLLDPAAAEIEHACEHVDQADDVLPTVRRPGLRLTDQRFNFGDVAEPELHHGKREQVFGIVRIEREGVLEQPERALRIGRQRERALMAQRRCGVLCRMRRLG